MYTQTYSTYTQVGAQMERNTEPMWGEAVKCRGKKRGKSQEKKKATEEPIPLNTSGYFCPELFLKRQNGPLSQLRLFPVDLFFESALFGLKRRETFYANCNK